MANGYENLLVSSYTGAYTEKCLRTRFESNKIIILCPTVIGGRKVTRERRVKIQQQPILIHVLSKEFRITIIII